METSSRDDFIIAIRSAFLKKGTQQRFSLIVLIFFSLILLSLAKLNFAGIDYLRSAIREVVYRSSFIVSTPENYLMKSYQNVKNHFFLYDDYLETKAQLKKIKSEKIANNYIIEENKRLKKIVDDYLVDTNEIVAKILIDKKSPFLRSIIINKGSKNNVKLGMAALDETFLVGKVVEVNYLTSRVLLLSDLNSKIPVTIEPGDYQSILSGTGRANGILQYLKEDYEIQEDNLIYTSGSGGVFKSGIPVGKIKLENENNLKTVEFFSDFTQLRFVKIISFKKELGND